MGATKHTFFRPGTWQNSPVAGSRSSAKKFKMPSSITPVLPDPVGALTTRLVAVWNASANKSDCSALK